MNVRAPSSLPGRAEETLSSDALVTLLRAGGEATRLRILALLATAGELNVKDLTQILGQSQPRVSRHLKVLCDAGLLERIREGASVFYGVPPSGPGAMAARTILDLADAPDEPLSGDRERLAAVVATRREAAARKMGSFRNFYG